MPERHDYAFPFRIDAASREAARTPWEEHVREMVLQLLLTTPGERADLPEFGCGLRALLFAGNSDATSATAQILVQHSLTQWLAQVLVLKSVEVLSPEATPDENQVVVRVEYELTATRAVQSVDVRVI